MLATIASRIGQGVAPYVFGVVGVSRTMPPHKCNSTELVWRDGPREGRWHDFHGLHDASLWRLTYVCLSSPKPFNPSLEFPNASS
jgi:hypothetical protein